MLSKLVNTSGVSGYETKIAEIIYFSLIKAKKNVKIDKAGNVICFLPGKAGNKKIIISAHMDEVGFQVIKRIEDNKYRIKPLGNIKTWNAIQQRVKSEKSVGVLYAYNEDQLNAHNYENIYLSIVEGEHASVGDIFTFFPNFIDGDIYYSGKALDNRLSCSILLDVINKEISTMADVYYVFTTQEEIGMRGVRVAKTTIKPDLCINIDMSAECDMNSIEMGKGVGIKVSDSISISSKVLVEQFENIAQDNKIIFQREVSDCGTSELIITNEIDGGCEEIGISIPCKYLHSANSLVNKNDYNETEKLITKVLENI